MYLPRNPLDSSPRRAHETPPAMPPAKDNNCTDEARDRRRMQNRLAQRRFRGQYETFERERKREPRTQ